MSVPFRNKLSSILYIKYICVDEAAAFVWGIKITRVFGKGN